MRDPTRGVGAGSALTANVLLRVAGQAGGLALTRRLATLPTAGPTEVGLIGGVADAMELVVAVPAGALSDRWGRRPLLVGGAAVGATGLLIVGLADLLPVLALGRALQGIGTGMTIPPLLGWFSDVTAARDAAGRARVMSGVGAGTAAGLLFGTVLGSVLWTRLGSGAFPVLAVLFLLATAFMTRAPDVASPLHLGEATRESGDGLLADLHTVLKAPGLARLLVAWMLLNAVVGLWLTHAVYQLDAPAQDAGQFLVGRFHGGTLDAVLGSWMLLFIAGSLLWGPLLPRVGEWRGMRLALAGMLLVCLSLLALNAPSLSEPARWAALLPFCAGVVMEAGFAPAALARLAHGAEHTHRGLAMALYSVAFGAGSLLGNWAGAPFVSWGAMNGITAATALLAALALGVLTVGRRAPGAGAAA